MFPVFLSFCRDRFILLILSSCFVVQPAIAASDHQVDSLKQQVEILLDSAWKLRNTNPELSKEITLETIAVSQYMGYQQGLMKGHSFAGVAYRNMGNFSEALKHYALGFEVAYKHNDTRQMAYAYLNLGNLQFYLQDPDAAISYLKPVYPLLESLNDPGIESYYWLDMGRAMLMKKSYDQAIILLTKALKIREKSGNKNAVAVCHKYLGDAYLGMDDYDKALESYTICQKISDFRTDSNLITSLKVNQARAYMHKNEYAKAEKIALEGLQLAETIPSLYVMKEASLVLSEITEANKQFEISADYLKNAIKLQDSIYSQNLEDRVERFKFQMEKLQFEHQQEISEIRAQKNKYILIISLVFFTVFTAAILRAIFLINKKNRKLLKQNHEINDLSNMKRDLMSMVAHDLKNLLNNVMLITESVEEHTPYSDSIRQSGNDMKSLITNILEVNRMEQQQIELVRESLLLKNMADRVINQMSFLIQHRLLVVNNGIDDSVFVMADIQYVERILCNLLNNAIKFSPNSATIDLWAEEYGEMLKVYIRDSGEGIPMEARDKIFDKFWRKDIHRVGSSFGLGLTFCKMALEAHGGDIGIHTTSEEGTTFWFTLPLAGHKAEKVVAQPINFIMSEEIKPANDELIYVQNALTVLEHRNVYEVSLINQVIESTDYDARRHRFTAAWVKKLQLAYETSDDELFNEVIEILHDHHPVRT